MSSPKYDFGVCSNPGITYNTSQHSFAPSDAGQFPFSSSLDIASLESDICRHLRTKDCAANTDAIRACNRARRRFSGRAGQKAADAWNKALGVEGAASDGGIVPMWMTTDSSAQSTLIEVDGSSTAVSMSEAALTSIETDTSPAPEMSTSAAGDVSTTASSSPTETTQATPTSSSTLTTAPAALPNQADTNGSPFGYENGSTPTKPRTTVLAVMTAVLLFASLI